MALVVWELERDVSVVVDFDSLNAILRNRIVAGAVVYAEVTAGT
jgi:hypothetical protein